MAKSKGKCITQKVDTQQTRSSSSSDNTISSLRAIEILWYKIKVLLYDLQNVRSKACEKRIECTTDRQYLSGPYFTTDEVAIIKATIVELPREEVEVEVEGEGEEHKMEGAKGADIPSTPGTESERMRTVRMYTIEGAIERRLANFHEKRSASGDSRPCGPHDLAPVYLEVFGMRKDEMQDTRFLVRLRRSGL
jgi:hypothetical protein